MADYSWLLKQIVRYTKSAYHQGKGYHNMFNLIPRPASLVATEGTFKLSSETPIQIDPANEEIKSLAAYLTTQLQNTLGFTLAVTHVNSGAYSIKLELDDSADLGTEGYELVITSDEIRLCAQQPAGLFYAFQTFLQMISSSPSESYDLPAVTIRDTPRFIWRGVMLDVARHFFGVQDVKRFIDLIVQYKINVLHLGLTNDQGWRIEIKSWPKLTEIGGSTQVGGNGGGFYTQEEYKELIEYARSRYVMIIPEIDVPGHINAALASYAELNCSGQAPALYEGSEVGFSSLCADKEITYQFLDDIVGELAAISPAPYIHIGGDEAKSTPPQDYKKIVESMQDFVLRYGKRAVGWGEIADAKLDPSTIAQFWDKKMYLKAKNQGCKIILSPANKTYLDMKYDENCRLGLAWIGYIGVKDSYVWDIESLAPELEEKDVQGVEAAVWSETLRNFKELEYMVFPRLLCIAELAWSSQKENWEEFRQRLAAHGKRMEAMGINFYRSPEIDWE
jgi:hexosaminidase